jgi:hypothetical protein
MIFFDGFNFEEESEVETSNHSGFQGLLADASSHDEESSPLTNVDGTVPTNSGQMVESHGQVQSPPEDTGFYDSRRSKSFIYRNINSYLYVSTWVSRHICNVYTSLGHAGSVSPEGPTYSPIMLPQRTYSAPPESDRPYTMDTSNSPLRHSASPPALRPPPLNWFAESSGLTGSCILEGGLSIIEPYEGEVSPTSSTSDMVPLEVFARQGLVKGVSWQNFDSGYNVQFMSKGLMYTNFFIPFRASGAHLTHDDIAKAKAEAITLRAQFERQAAALSVGMTDKPHISRWDEGRFNDRENLDPIDEGREESGTLMSSDDVDFGRRMYVYVHTYLKSYVFFCVLVTRNILIRVQDLHLYIYRVIQCS